LSECLIKNIDKSKVFLLASLVDYGTGQVISRTLAQGTNLTLTLFAFDQGEEISAHSSSGDAIVYIMDGQAEVTIGDNKYQASKGECIVMPAGIPHALYAVQRFKMLLTVVFNP
jgi:quercetin dioxygenase-like cupin family protein